MKSRVLDIIREKARKVLRQALSPAFLMILLGSFLLWYTSKLSLEYEIEMPLNLRIDGQKYRVTALVRGHGSTLLAQKMGLKSKLNLTLEELSTRPSRDNKEARIINPASLQRAINGIINELQVKLIIDAPEFKPAPEGETPRERRKRERQERRDQRRAEAELEKSLDGAK